MLRSSTTKITDSSPPDQEDQHHVAIEILGGASYYPTSTHRPYVLSAIQPAADDDIAAEIADELGDDLDYEFSHFPDQFLSDLAFACAQASTFTFLICLSEDTMRYFGCTNKQIHRLGVIAELLSSLYTGSFIASSAALLTNRAFHIAGYSNQTANIASSTVATGFYAAQNFSLFGVARTAASAIGSYTGCRLTLWARSQATAYTRSRQARFREAAEKEAVFKV